VRQLAAGWRRHTYRGRHRARSHRVGHLATGIALFYAVHLR
jgi:hypothetical protein